MTRLLIKSQQRVGQVTDRFGNYSPFERTRCAAEGMPEGDDGGSLFGQLRCCLESCREVECSATVSRFVVNLRHQNLLPWVFLPSRDRPVDDSTDAKTISCRLEELLLNAAVDGSA